MSEVFIDAKQYISKISAAEKEVEASIAAALIGKYVILKDGSVKKISGIKARYCFNDIDIKISVDCCSTNVFASELSRDFKLDHDVQIFSTKKEAENAVKDFIQAGGIYESEDDIDD